MPTRETHDRVDRIMKTPASDVQELRSQINALGQALLDLDRDFRRFETEIGNRLNELIKKVHRMSG